MIKRYKLFTMPACDKCTVAKEYLKGITFVTGVVVDLGSDAGMDEMRTWYPKVKDRIKRNEDGSIVLPVIFFFDENDEIVVVAHGVEEIKRALENKSLFDVV